MLRHTYTHNPKSDNNPSSFTSTLFFLTGSAFHSLGLIITFGSKVTITVLNLLNLIMSDIKNLPLPTIAICQMIYVCHTWDFFQISK